MEYITLVLSIISCIITIIILIFVLKNKGNNKTSFKDDDLKKIRDSVNESINGLGVSVTNLIATKNENIINELNKKVEQVVTATTKLEKDAEEFRYKIVNILNETANKQDKSFAEFKNKYSEDNNKQKEEIMNRLALEIKSFNDAFKASLSDFDKSMKEKLDEFKNNTKDSIKQLSDTVNKNLDDIRKDNSDKLEKINTSVNEKLQKTLEEKLNNSFKSVIEGIGDVNKAVGEIKSYASDVGSLKNILTNVKTKGILGEVMLGNIISDFLTKNQYVENVATKKGSNERVEFAIILPGTKDEKIYLPVDSKFPYEAYATIHESNNIDEINQAKKELRTNLLKYAKDVHDKYIDVPNTTDFAIIFLPLEGLYLEALNMGLFEEIQKKYKVNLTGPTTFTAFVNSLNMGFKSLLIQKKSADVFTLLAAVKTEFGKFADALEVTQKKVNMAADELDKLVNTRTKAMNKKLSTIDTIDEKVAEEILEIKDNNN